MQPKVLAGHQQWLRFAVARTCDEVAALIADIQLDAKGLEHVTQRAGGWWARGAQPRGIASAAEHSKGAGEMSEERAHEAGAQQGCLLAGRRVREDRACPGVLPNNRCGCRT